MNLIKYSLSLFCLTLLTLTPAHSAPLSSSFNNDLSKTLQHSFKNKRLIALSLATQYPQIATLLQRQINQYQLTINLQDIFLGQVVTQLTTADLLQLRLADTSMLLGWQQGQPPLFTYEPDNPTQQQDYIEAFDIEGKTQILDITQLPQQPVFIVSNNSNKQFTAGMKIMRSILTQTNLRGSEAPSLNHSTMQDLDETSIDTTTIKSISVKQSNKPWLWRRARIFAIVTGVSPEREAPMIDVVEMPYLAFPNTVYNPNQILIHWSRYRWSAVDLILMSHEDNTDYQALATKILEVAQHAFSAAPQAPTQGYGLITRITNEIMKIMPNSWFNNRARFVDAYYTLQKDVNYINLEGATGNATTSFEPLTINALP